MNETIENIISKTKLAAGMAIFAVRAVLPLALRVAIVSAIAAFLLFLYAHGPRNTIEFLLSCLVSLAEIFRLPILKLHDDPPAAVVFAVLIYGGTGWALFHPKSPIFWITAFMFILPVSDAIYGLRYCSRAFRRHWNNPETFYRSAKRFFRNEPVFGFPLFNEPPEKRALFLETDTFTLSKMEKLNSWFREKFPKEKFVPYVERVDTDGNQTTFVCFRPSGFPLVKFEKEDDSNPLLHTLGYGTETHSVSAKNVRKLRITVEDVSKPIPALPFSQILPLVRKSEYVFGEDTEKKGLVRMKVEPGANSMLILLGIPGTGKSNLLTALIISLYEANGEDVRFVVTTTKPDLSFAKSLPGVLKYADEPKAIVEAVNLVLREIESRKKLFSEKGARDVREYNELPGTAKLKTVFAIFDELGDTIHALWMIDDAKKSLSASYLKAITRISITARAYGIITIVATQSGLVSIFGQNGSEFRNSFSPVAFSLQTSAAENSVFGDSESWARRIPKGVCVWYDVSVGEYRRIRTPLVTKADIDAFLAKHGTEAEPTDGKTSEEKYLEYAKKKGSLSLQDATAHGIPERQYRTLCSELQNSWAVAKLPNNTLAFIPETQSENGLRNAVPEDRKDGCESNCKTGNPDPEKP